MAPLAAANGAGKKGLYGMRWHPLIIRWCLSIYLTSPAAYKQLSSKQTKFLVLPSTKTLKQYINFTDPSTGFNPDIIQQLVLKCNLSECKDYEKNVSLLFDEMRIKSGLVYRKGDGNLVGFCEMGAMNDEIDRFQRSLDTDDDGTTLARYVNVFMARGIFTDLAYPFGFHASNGLTGEQLCSLAWEATSVLERIGLKVRAWVSDGAAPNRKCFGINTMFNEDDEFYWTVNIFCPSRKIYLVSDAPHLIKTTRNNLENSHGNTQTRNLHVDGQDVGWHHILNVYKWDLGENRAAPGLRMLHKLTEDHISLSPRHRMRVKLAVQVVSNSVACALERQNLHNTKSTIRFIQLFDKAFDCLNVSRYRTRDKPARRPYFSVDDSRFDFLQKEFLGYLSSWRSQVSDMVGTTKEQKQKLCISMQTEFGWKLTVNSFVALAKTLLEEEGVKFLLSEKFSQDPLEEHFSRQRRSGGANENPTLAQFQRQEVMLNVVGSNLITDLKGNVSSKHDGGSINIHDTRLPPKRPRDKKKED